jgi:hypothetical protein
VLSYWTDTGVEKEALLQPLLQQLHEAGYPTFTDSGWKPWDLMVDGQLWSRIPLDVVVENHGGSKRLARIRISRQFAPISKGILWTCGSLLILGLLQARPWMAGAASVVALGSCLWVAYQSASVIHEIYDIGKDVAAQLKLLPINGNNGPS